MPPLFRNRTDAMARKLVTRRSTIHGNGVFAGAPIAKGERLIQYKGKLRTHDQVDRAYADEDETGHTFLFTLNDDYVIDANIDGNNARWINHSCNPNCEAVFYEDESGNKRKDKVWIESMRAIKPGEELTYNYGIVLAEPHTPALKKLWGCRCGSRNCTGTMLQPKRKPAVKAKPKSGRKPARAKKA
jgi:SET domain-containing protein